MAFLLLFLQRVSPGSVALLGSSILAYWRSAAEDLAPLPISNVAVAGRTTRGLLSCSVRPRAARVWLIYCGSNDLRALGSPSGTAARLAAFVAAAPLTVQVVLVGALRSPDRAAWADTVTEYNARLVSIAAADPSRRSFVDVNPGIEGDSACFLADGLHLTREGYRRFAANMRATLDAAWARSDPARGTAAAANGGAVAAAAAGTLATPIVAAA